MVQVAGRPFTPLRLQHMRCVKPPGFGHVVEARLHHFSDASENAYGTASYLVMVHEQGEAHCSFVMGKSRVAPLKQVTVPKRTNATPA